MKRLLLPLPLFAALWLVSCEQPSDNASSITRPGPSSNSHGGSGTVTPANPAIAYQGSVRSHGQTYQTIAVMDSDYTHQTSIYGDGINATYSYRGPSWSPNNGSIAFIRNSGTAAVPVNSIMAVDVTLSSTGTVSGTNARTIYALPSGQVDNGWTTAWSNTSATDMIAYGTRTITGPKQTAVWVVPASGGTPVKVWGMDTTFVKEDGSVIGHTMPVGWATWSPDDSRLAFERFDSGARTSYATSGISRAVTIMIFSTTDHGATWTYTDSIKHSSTGGNSYFDDIQWSRTGQNKLALSYHEDGLLYYANPSTNTTLTTDGLAGGAQLSWSPDNSSILHNSSSSIWKSVPYTTTVYATATSPTYGDLPVVRWKH
jgi:hypothetical protein